MLACQASAVHQTLHGDQATAPRPNEPRSLDEPRGDEAPLCGIKVLEVLINDGGSREKRRRMEESPESSSVDSLLSKKPEEEEKESASAEFRERC